MLGQLSLATLPTEAEKVLAGIAARLTSEITAAERRFEGRPAIQVTRDRVAGELRDKQALVGQIVARLSVQAAVGQIEGLPVAGEEMPVAVRLRAAVAEAHLPDMRTHLEQLRQDSAADTAAADQARAQAHAAWNLAAKSLELLDMRAVTAESPEGVHTQVPDLPAPDPAERQALADEVQSHQVTEARHREACEGLKAQLGQDPAGIDEAAETARLDALHHQQAVCRLAAGVIDRARQSVISRLLPDTRQFASLILPILTNNRYRDLDLDEGSYQVQVWDERFGRLVKREIYSGGAQDQFALSLRLGFALAALPQSLGTVPAFIFLDEPVASFDRIRREAFVELVRTGLIGQRFEQVFVAEPEGIFPENPFPHFLRLEAGRVVEQSWGPIQ